MSHPLLKSKQAPPQTIPKIKGRNRVLNAENVRYRGTQESRKCWIKGPQITATYEIG